MRPAKSDHVEIEEYDHPTGGWGSLKSLAKHAAAEGLAVSDIRATLLTARAWCS